MAAINTLGVDSLSLRGAGSQYHRLSRFFATHAEAQAAIDSGDWTPEAGVHNACVTGDEGVLLYSELDNSLHHTDTSTRAYVDTQVADVLTNAPTILDELNSIAGSLAADADYIATLNTKIDADIETERNRASDAEAALQTDILNVTTDIAGIKDGFDFTGAITAPAVGNVIPFYYDDQVAFPTAADVHGAIAHSHDDGAMYFAHGGTWHKLLHSGSSATELTDLDTVYVSLATLMDVVANSTDFADFKTRVADLDN